MITRFVVLMVAKAPVAGLAKTRLTPPATPYQAAEIAAAALLDTLDAMLATPGALPVVAMTGDLTNAVRCDELRSRLGRAFVVEQRGTRFADRLANAHADAARAYPGLPIVQIGMDTPQVTPALLVATASALDDADAALGPATDGGWWVLGLTNPANAELLRGVPMSTPDTFRDTWAALVDAGLHASKVAELSDVDTIADAEQVAGEVPESRFAAAVHATAGARRC
ncbi:MAG TPA: DUF2064 domain-containing protein [Pseudonocardiaceae bacterium]|nr:DUF2064 domain-containing protein [Pseudonocardiaceae bacterium]